MAVSNVFAHPTDAVQPNTRPTEAVCIRAATPADVPQLLQMKLQLAISEQTEFAMRATESDWLRDGFGPNAQFTAFVAECDSQVVGMVTVSDRYYTGWAGPGLYIQDLFVATRHRRRGAGTALLERVAAHAVERCCPLIELTMRDGNVARKLYRRAGFNRVQHCSIYVLGGQALVDLAATAATTT